jgi:hypothetical protein
VFGRKKAAANKAEYERAQADVMNGRDTPRSRALGSGKLTKNGYADGTAPGDPKMSRDLWWSNKPKVVK